MIAIAPSLNLHYPHNTKQQYKMVSRVSFDSVFSFAILAILSTVVVISTMASAENQSGSTRGSPTDLLRILSPVDDDVSSFIVGGSDAKAGEYPYFTQLKLDTTMGRYSCGGILITPDAVLSAAHCADVGEGHKVRKYEAYVGAVTSESLTDGAVYRTCIEWITHPLFVPQVIENGGVKPGTGILGGNDFALCRLNDPVEIDDNDPLVVLNDDYDFPPAGESLAIMGFGYTQSDRWGLATTLQETALPALDQTECDGAYGGIGRILDSMMCAWDESEETAECGGDSGGPLVYKDGDRHVVAGISSFSVRNCGSIPGVFSRVSAGLDWIRATLCQTWDLVDSDFCLTNSPTVAPTCGGLVLTISVTTDTYGYESSWTLEKLSDDAAPEWIAVETNNLSKDNYSYEDILCLESGSTYKWTISDTYGDGIQSSMGGNFELNLDGERILTYRGFAYNLEHSFNTPVITESPTDSPSNSPTDSPSGSPTDSPSDLPTDSRSDSPTDSPSESPTDSPSDSPTDSPSDSPTVSPSDSPTDSPSDSPTDSPSDSPTDSPSGSPTDSPSDSPTDSPSGSPTDSPSDSPTDSPSGSPTDSPSDSPTDSPPSNAPSNAPTSSNAPSNAPTVFCENRPDSWETDAGKTVSCINVATFSGNRAKKCKKNSYKENCPGLCNNDCSCNDYEYDFTYNDRPVNCDNLSAKKCRKKIVAMNCPILCDDSCPLVMSCENRQDSWETDAGKTVSCINIATYTGNRAKKCKKNSYKENCPGLCNSDCSCNDYEYDFTFNNRNTNSVNCATLSANNCKNRRVAMNCPILCDASCMV